MLCSELLARLGVAVVAPRDIAGDRFRPAFGRIAEAAAARRRYAHHVTGPDVYVLILGQMRRAIDLAVLAHLHGVGAAVLAAQDALRAGAAVVHHHRDPRLAASQADRIVDAEAAAEFARAARTLAQREFLEQNRIELLQHLDRGHLGDADGRAAVGEAVAALEAAVTTAREQVHDVVPASLGVVAADSEIARGAGGSGKQPIGDRLGERGEH